MLRDFEEIKMEVLDRVDAVRVAEWCQVGGMKRVKEGHFVAPCPFHAEKSASFNIGGGNAFRGRMHCFGCGWDGDVIAFWMQVKGCDFKQALMDLAREAGVSVGEGIDYGPRTERPVARQPERALDESQLPPELPPLRHLKRAECELVAEKRGLDGEAVWLAARRFHRMAFSEWPLYRRWNGVWLPRCLVHGRNGCALDKPNCVAGETFPSWCAIDRTRRVAEFRRLDNALYEISEGRSIKAWSTRGKSWPVGASMIGDKLAVMLVEGGPDMLAAYHFLLRHRMLERVAVVCMLGAGNRLHAEALPYFKGRRVRIMVDADPLKDGETVRQSDHETMGQGDQMKRPKLKKRSMPGMEAAARWSAQLTEVGAAVETFCVGPRYEPEDIAAWGRREMDGAAVRILTPGLVMPDGSPVKDLNDLAKCSEQVTTSADVREAFTCWDF